MHRVAVPRRILSHNPSHHCVVARGVGNGPSRVVAAASADQKDQKVALITGANTGIGFETAKALGQQVGVFTYIGAVRTAAFRRFPLTEYSQLENYRVVLACRDLAKAEAARASLQSLIPHNADGFQIAQFDLADLSSVRDWSMRALDAGQPLDVLINNAGVMACPQMSTKDGFELQFGVNHLGHFALTSMLMPLLTGDGRSTRIVNVSSAGHFGGTIDFDDINRSQKYDPWGAYFQSKLANVLFSYELARKLHDGTAHPSVSATTSTTVNALHPGVVATELGRYLFNGGSEPAWWQRPLVSAIRAVSLTPEQGAATSIYLASSPDVQDVTGKYWDKCKPVASSKASYDIEAATKLWALSEELVEGVLGAEWKTQSGRVAPSATVA